MRASAHIVNVGVSTLPKVLRTPKPSVVPGLRHANVGIAAPLSASLLAKPQLRVGLLAFWDDDSAIDAFLASSAAAPFASGWSVRLEPLRMHGSWPGVDTDIAKARAVTGDGPVAVLTLGRLRFTRLLPFLKASAKAEGAVVGAEGLTWATGLARPPFLATCSLWESGTAAAQYAYGTQTPAHHEAILAGNAEPFHHQEAFIRFRPYAEQGHLEGRNPKLDARAVD